LFAFTSLANAAIAEQTTLLLRRHSSAANEPETASRYVFIGEYMRSIIRRSCGRQWVVQASNN